MALISARVISPEDSPSRDQMHGSSHDTEMFLPCVSVTSGDENVPRTRLRTMLSRS